MNLPTPFATAIVLAGGAGTRMEKCVKDKILLKICGKSVLEYSLEAFAACKTVNSIIIVYRDEKQKQSIEALIPEHRFEKVLLVQGGERRQDSVWAGISKRSPECNVLLIHDAARPLVSPDSIDAVSLSAKEKGVACIARRSTDTLKLTSPTEGGYELQTIDRSHIWAMETPQGFQTSLIVKGYQETMESGKDVTDDLSAIENDAIPVDLIDRNEPNPKLTSPQDVAYIEFLIQKKLS